VSFYAHHVLPLAMDFVLTRPFFGDQRRAAMRDAAGRVLEVGFGIGASVEAYAAATAVRELWALDPNPGMLRRALPRVRRSPLRIHLLRGSAEALPFPNAAFDTVISNWTLCSLADPGAGLAEMRRVLRPDGRFLFLEHGLAPDPRLARRQRWLTPLQRRLAGGCRLDLDIDATIRAAGYRIETLERYDAGRGPKTLRQMYRGVARP
jgi:SAM-dependent methyltransferase